MKALQLAFSIPSYVIGKAAGAILPGVYTGPMAMLRYREIPEPGLPDEHWVKVQVRYGGICGSDLHTVLLHSSPALQPYVSFPFVPGHEIVGHVVERGAAVHRVAIGERVVVDPVLSCVTRGLGPCRFCREGRYSLCQNFTRGALPAALSIGHCRATGGGWGPFLVAHESQVLPVPPQVSDENAILAEPLAVALHAVAHRVPSDDERVIIIGMGTIGLCILAVLRALGSKAHVIALYRHAFQGVLAQHYGADRIIRSRGQEHYAAVADAVEGRVVHPLMSKPVLLGGADVVYECVGHAASVDDALRFARPGGMVVMVGLVGMPRGIDWTPIWLHELTLWGSFWASTEQLDRRRQRAFQAVLDLLAQGKLDVGRLVTHRYPLTEYHTALCAARAKGQQGMVKAVFDYGMRP